MSDEWIGFEINGHMYDLHILTQDVGEEELTIYPVKKDGSTDMDKVVLRLDLRVLAQGATSLPNLIK